MRQRSDARTILVDKAQLIAKIKENKENHIKEYNEAVIAYKEEAIKQLKANLKFVNDGGIGFHIRLTEPVDASDEYDKILQMFDWELADKVELSQGEFNEYVLDETPNILSAKMSNTFYTQTISKKR